MTQEQCEKFLAAVEAAGIKSYRFTSDIGTHLYNDGTTAIAKPIYSIQAVVGLRRTKYSGAVQQFSGNINVDMIDFPDVHEILTGGSYNQIKTFCDTLGMDLNSDDLKILLEIDKGNYDIKPENGDYVNTFKYLSESQYEALSPEEKAEYDNKKAAYEKAKREYIPANQAASITM